MKPRNTPGLNIAERRKVKKKNGGHKLFSESLAHARIGTEGEGTQEIGEQSEGNFPWGLFRR